jgi:oligopeptidase B
MNLPPSDAPATPRYRPPEAPECPTVVTSAHGQRTDPWYWLRDDSRSDPVVLAHLSRENAACERWFRPLEPWVQRLQSELAARVPPEHTALAAYEHGWWYQARYRPGAEHPLHVRWREGAAEEVLLDVAEAARGHVAYTLGALEVSPDGRWLAWTEDLLGRHQYTLRLIDRHTGTEVPIELSGLDADVAFLNDGSILYIRQQPVTHWGHAVWRHVPGTPTDADRVLYTESDDAFSLSLSRSRSGEYVYLRLDSTSTSEVHYVHCGATSPAFRVTLPREPGHEYDLEDAGAEFLLRTNDAAVDFRLVLAPIDAASDRSRWRTVVPPRDGVVLTDALVFATHYAVAECVEGLGRVRIIDRQGGEDRLLSAPHPAATLWMDVNLDAAAPFLRYAWGSLAHPTTRLAYHWASGESQCLRVDPVEGGHDPAQYVVQRRWVAARDGARIPVSLLRHRDTPCDGTAALLLTGYGAYGYGLPALFDATVLPLVDRGFVYAIAHVRGGDELGRAWYDAGRLEHKHHTFEDFIDVRRALVAAGDVNAARCCASGASAGGLLMGVVANEAPQEFCAIVAHVPFVDVLTSMLDEDLPLTALEYEEWGDPSDAADYATIARYSPVDNVRVQDYPALWVTGGLHDAQVPYWESAKWVARLRRHQTAAAPILLWMNLDAGHGGATGRYAAHREMALEQAFLLECVGGVTVRD